MDEKVKVLWKQWEVRDALDRHVAMFDTLAAAKRFNRLHDNGLFVDRIETLDARHPDTGDYIQVRFMVQ